MRGPRLVLLLALAVALGTAAFYALSASRPPFVPRNPRDATPYGGVLEVGPGPFHPGDAIPFTLANGGTFALRAEACAVAVEHLEGGGWRRVNADCPGPGPLVPPGGVWRTTWVARLADGSPAPPGPYRGRLTVEQGDATRTLIVGFELLPATERFIPGGG